MASQFGAVRYGTPIRTSPIPTINARAAYLPQLYSLREAERQNAELLAENKRQFGLSYGLAQEQQEEAERQAKRAGQLGLGNLALSVGMGIRQNAMASDTGKAISALMADDAPRETADAATSFLSGKASSMATGSPITFGSATAGDYLSGSGYLNALGSSAPWLGGAAGAIAGPKIGSMLPFGGEKEKGIIGGALAGGAVGYLAGGDIYSTITGALLGGVGGGW